MSVSNRLASLASRMLNNESREQQNNDEENGRASIKRNLFGCRLDHEQLHADLQQMLAEQRRVKSAQWSFDFDALRPIQGGRVEWRKIRVAAPTTTTTSSDENLSTKQEGENEKQRHQHQQQQQQTSKSSDSKKYNNNLYASTEISVLIGSDEDYDDEEEEEEEDEALAVPEFYKRQRRLKLVEVDKNRLNVLNNVAAPNKAPNKTNVDNNTQTTKPSTSNTKSKTTATTTMTPIKPKVSRASRKVAHFEQLANILTYSENRKDTLRSASASTNRRTTENNTTRTLKQSLNSAFVTQSARKPTKSAATKQTKTTNDDKMRQQTLHDLNVFKQRKKRVQFPDSKLESKTTSENSSTSHYLRSHSQSQSTTTTTTTTTTMTAKTS